MCLKASFHLVPSDQVCVVYDTRRDGVLGSWGAAATASRWLVELTKRALVVTVDVEALPREAGECTRDFGFVAHRDVMVVVVLVEL